MISRLPCLSKCLFTPWPWYWTTHCTKTKSEQAWPGLEAYTFNYKQFKNTNICWFLCLLIKLQVFIQLLCILCVWGALVLVVTFFTLKLKCFVFLFEYVAEDKNTTLSCSSNSSLSQFQQHFVQLLAASQCWTSSLPAGAAYVPQSYTVQLSFVSFSRTPGTVYVSFNCGSCCELLQESRKNSFES